MSFLNSLFRLSEKALEHPSTIAQQRANESSAQAPALATKPFFVLKRAFDDTLEAFVPSQKSTLHVFTCYTQGKEDFIVSWHPALPLSMKTPQKITSVVNFIFEEYPLCSLDHFDEKYKFNLSLLRNYSGKSDMTNAEEYAVRFVFASRLLIDYTKFYTLLKRTHSEKL